MNKKIIKNGVKKIAEKVIEINLNTDLCVFFEIWGHVEKIEVRISESKENYSNRIFKEYFYYDRKNCEESFDEMLKKIEEAVSNAKNLIKEGREKLEKKEREEYKKLKAKFEK